MSQEKNGKGLTVQTSLDGLPYGDLNDTSMMGRVKNVLKPQGITSKMLIMDIFLIAWPSLLELILTQLTSMADQMMVGRLPGMEGVMALSAVGLAMQPKFLLMTMIQSMNVGSTAIIARYRGQQNRERANQVFMQCILLNFVMSIVFMTLGTVFAEDLIRFMSGKGISEDTLMQATQYLRIQMYGFVPLCLSFTITAALRGIADTKTPLFYNTMANVINVIFNYLMIYGKFGFPRMGVMGASIATVVGQTVASAIAIGVALSKRRYIYIDLKEKFKFDMGIMKNVTTIGVPAMVEMLFMRVGILIFVRTVSGLGDTLYATHQICMNIQAMTMMMGQAFASATTSLMGQSLGKRRMDMAMLYMQYARRLGMAVACAFGVVLILFGEQIVGLYNSTPEVKDIGGKILLMVAVMQPIQSSQFIVSGGLRGAGDTKFSAVVTAITVIGVRSGLAVLLINFLDFGLWGAWIALVSDQAVRTLCMTLRYQSGKWKAIRLASKALSGEGEGEKPAAE